MPKIMNLHPDTKATITLGVLIMLAGAMFYAGVAINDMRRDIADVKAMATEFREVKGHVDVLWWESGRISMNPPKKAAP